MKIIIKSSKRIEFIDITGLVQESLKSSGIQKGVCMLFVPHTTAAITINESADPSVKYDILMSLNKSIPESAGYRHMEGNSDAHIKSTIVGCSEFVFVENNSLVLGTWQGIFFCEFDGPRTRKVYVRFI